MRAPALKGERARIGSPVVVTRQGRPNPLCRVHHRWKRENLVVPFVVCRRCDARGIRR